MKIQEIYDRISELKASRHHWRNATREYAKEMLESIIVGDFDPLSGESDFTEIGPNVLLNHVGANGMDWDDARLPGIAREASFGGNFLVYNGDVAYRVLSPRAYAQAERSRKGWDGEMLLNEQAKYLLAAMRLIRETAEGK